MSRSVQLGINRQHFARFLFLPRCLAPRQMPNASKWRLILIGESSFSKRLRIPHNLLLSRCAQCVCRGESKCVVKSDDSVNCTGGRGERVAHCFQYLSQTRRRERPLRMTLCWAKSDYLICGWFLCGSIWMISQNLLLNSRLCQLLKEFTKV